MRIIFLVGPPLAGKDTQAGLLASLFNTQVISAGEILRRADDEEVNKIMKEGKVVGVKVLKRYVLGWIKEHLDILKKHTTLIITGMPRAKEDLEVLDEIVKLFKPSHVDIVVLDISLETAKKRLEGRYICPKCGRVYNIYTAPPKNDLLCDDDKTPLIRRIDDKEKGIVEKRFDHYLTVELPAVLEFARPFHLVKINGEGSINEVFKRICKALFLECDRIIR